MLFNVVDYKKLIQRNHLIFVTEVKIFLKKVVCGERFTNLTVVEYIVYSLI